MPSKPAVIKANNAPVKAPKVKTLSVAGESRTVSTNQYYFNPFSGNFFLWYWLFIDKEPKNDDKK